jgi:hypothetical protein
MMAPSLLHLLVWAGLVCWVLGQAWFAEVFDRPVCARQARRALAGRPAPPAPMPQVAMVSGFAVFLGPLPLALFGPALPIGLHALNIVAGVWGLVVTVRLLRRRESEFARWQRCSRGRALATAAHAVLALIMVCLVFVS